MDEAAVDQFVARLVKERTRLRLSRAELAALTKGYGDGVSYHTLRRIELGECKPRPATVRTLEYALGKAEGLERGNGRSGQPADPEVRAGTA